MEELYGRIDCIDKIARLSHSMIPMEIFLCILEDEGVFGSNAHCKIVNWGLGAQAEMMGERGEIIILFFALFLFFSSSPSG